MMVVSDKREIMRIYEFISALIEFRFGVKYLKCGTCNNYLPKIFQQGQ